jgi:imidazolonepropionase-like amidohydrolase
MPSWTKHTRSAKKTAAHAHGAEGAKRATRPGIDSIEHGTFLDDEALDMMKVRGTLKGALDAAHSGRHRMFVLTVIAAGLKRRR